LFTSNLSPYEGENERGVKINFTSPPPLARPRHWRAGLLIKERRINLTLLEADRSRPVPTIIAGEVFVCLEFLLYN